MGWPSSHEHDQEKRDDAAFADHEMRPDLKAIFVAPVAKRSKAKKKTKSAGAPPDTQIYVQRLEQKVRRLESELTAAHKALAAEKAHVVQLKERQNKGADLLLQGEVRQLKADHAKEVARLKSAVEAKDRELRDLREMNNLFGKNG